MNFLKKYSLLLILLLVLGSIALFPSVKNFIFPVAEIENHLKFDTQDYEVKLKGINTQNAALSDFKNKKILFLNFWGTWCKPCRDEFPSIQKLYDKKKNTVDFVLIAMQDEEENVKKFLTENNYSVPVYIAQSPINKNILPQVFPTTFLLDASGRILLKEQGSKNWDSEDTHSFISKFAP